MIAQYCVPGAVPTNAQCADATAAYATDLARISTVTLQLNLNLQLLLALRQHVHQNRECSRQEEGT